MFSLFFVEEHIRMCPRRDVRRPPVQNDPQFLTSLYNYTLTTRYLLHRHSAEM